MQWTFLEQLLPALSGISPITVIGLGVLVVALVLYGLTQVPEYLIVVATSALYTLVPLLKS